MEQPSREPPAGSGSGIDPLTLAATLCARVCHDLAGTLGALAGMLDVKQPDGTPDPEALSFALACAGELVLRLRLLRTAWGAESEMGDLRALAAGLPGADRLTLDLDGLQGETGPEWQRLAACLLLVAAGGLPRGGTIRLHAQAGSLGAAIDGPRAAWPASLAACAEPEGLARCGAEPRGVAAAMLHLQAQALGLQIHLPSAVELELRPSGRAADEGG